MPVTKGISPHVTNSRLSSWGVCAPMTAGKTMTWFLQRSILLVRTGQDMGRKRPMSWYMGSKGADRQEDAPHNGNHILK